jgi:hypothetical protein
MHYQQQAIQKESAKKRTIWVAFVLVLALMLLSINVVNGSESTGGSSDLADIKRYQDWRHSTMLHSNMLTEMLSSGNNEIGTLNELTGYF